MTDAIPPPATAERLLSCLLTEENREAVLGDFTELYSEHARTDGLRAARTWYWAQVLKSSPALCQLKVSTFCERTFTTMNRNLNLHNKFSLITGLTALMPALVLVIPGLMQSAGYIGLNDMRDDLFTRSSALQILLNPFVLLGGLLLAFTLNLLPAMKLRFERQPEGLISVITLKPVVLHWLLVGISLLMVGIILLYAFLENFKPALP